MKRTMMLVLSAAILAVGTSIGSADPANSEPPAQKLPTTGKPETSGKLSVGDPAPKLSIEKWVKGTEVKEFEKGKVYLVEFWATWCGPCIQSMPHLSALQKQYKDQLTIIGVTSKDPNNSLENVEKMVAAKGDVMAYTVAWDKARDTNKAFMDAAQQRGIPCGFVVDKVGNIAYIGHPMFLDIVLDKVIAGTWDYKAGPADVKKAETAMMGVYRKAGTDPKAALTALAEFETAYPTIAVNMLDMKYALQVQAEDPGAKATGEKIYDKAVAHNDAEALNALAWGIVAPDAPGANKDLPFALKAAKKASELTKDSDPMILDTLARAYFLTGEKAKAFETQTKAVALATDPELKTELEKALAEYK